MVYPCLSPFFYRVGWVRRWRRELNPPVSDVLLCYAIFLETFIIPAILKHGSVPVLLFILFTSTRSSIKLSFPAQFWREGAVFAHLTCSPVGQEWIPIGKKSSDTASRDSH